MIVSQWRAMGNTVCMCLWHLVVVVAQLFFKPFRDELSAAVTPQVGIGAAQSVAHYESIIADLTGPQACGACYLQNETVFYCRG